jgi:hypothetical protein
VGLSLGWVTGLWLTPLRSQADHRLSHVEPWAEQRRQTLRRGLGPRVPPLDLRAERWAAGLEALCDTARWAACESALNRQVLRG